MKGSEVSRGKTVSIIEFLITIALGVLIFIYLSLAAYTKDGLWFWPVFDSQPASVLIYCYGDQKALSGDSTEGQELAQRLNTQVSGSKRWDELNLTDETYQDYITNPASLVVKFIYAQPERIHSQSPFFTDFTALILPVDARHADTAIIFSLINDKPAGGSFHLETIQPIKDYLTQSGLCVKP